MTSVPKSRRFEVLARDGFKCRYCGTSAAIAQLHVDHVKPRSRDGGNNPDNLVAACADCNSGKSDRELIPARQGYDLTRDRRPARMAKMRHAKAAKQVDFCKHVLNPGEVDSLDEIDEDCQLALVWCHSHQKFEWHNLPQDVIGRTCELVRITKPGWKGAL